MRGPRTSFTRRLVALTGLLWAALFVTLVVYRAGDLSGPIHLGGRTTNPAHVPPDLVVQLPEQSYDGQFFYRQGVAPLSTDREVHGVSFDSTGLRAARIGYPAVVWTLSAGQAGAVPAAMLAVNVLAVGLLGAAGVLLARELGLGRASYFGLVFVLLPGVTYAMALDLADALATACTVLALLGLTRGRKWPVAAALSAAVLCRESTLVLVIPIAAAMAWDGLRSARGSPSPSDSAATHSPVRAGRELALTLLAAITPFLVAVVWQVTVKAHWGEFGWVSSGSSNLRPPFSAIYATRALFVPSSGPNALRLFVLMSIGVAAAAGLMAAFRCQGTGRWMSAVALLGGLVTFVSLSPTIMSNHHNFGRSATELLIASAWAGLNAKGPIRTLVEGWIGIMGLTIAVWEVVATAPLA